MQIIFWLEIGYIPTKGLSGTEPNTKYISRFQGTDSNIIGCMLFKLSVAQVIKALRTVEKKIGNFP